MKILTAAVMMTVFFLTFTVSAQNPAPVEMKFSKTEITNLVNGIISENAGLKKSSIYYAGLYKVNEAVDALTKVLKSDRSASIRLLAARALYEIGNAKGMKAVYELSKNDRNIKVRKMSRALYNEFETPHFYDTYTILK